MPAARFCLPDNVSLRHGLVIVVVIGDADKIEHREQGLARCLAGTTAAHLPVEDHRTGEACHDQVDHLGGVEAGIEHVHGNEDLREFLLLEPLDLGGRIQGVVLAESGNDEVGIAHLRRGFLVCEGLVEHLCQGLGMALGDGEDDGLADQRFAQDTLGIGVALLHHLLEFPHDGPVAFRDGELALQGVGIDLDAIGTGEKLLEFLTDLG